MWNSEAEVAVRTQIRATCPITSTSREPQAVECIELGRNGLPDLSGIANMQFRLRIASLRER